MTKPICELTYAFGEYQRMTLMKKNVIVSEKVRSYSSIFIRIYGYDEYILYRKSLKHIRLFNFSHMFFIHLTTVMNLKYCQVWFYKKEKSHKYCWIVHLLYYKETLRSNCYIYPIPNPSPKANFH